MDYTNNMQLIHGDCLEKMKDISDKSIDMILCDLPYGTTSCKWDVVIPFNKYILSSKNKVIYQNQFILEEMKNGLSYQDSLQKFNELAKGGLWEQYKRIIKDRGAIVLFGSEPFNSLLRCSNIASYKYDWIWDKKKPANFPLAKLQPMKYHEVISVFNAKRYYPIMVPVKGRKAKKGVNKNPTVFNGGLDRPDYLDKIYTDKYPSTILEFSNANQSKDRFHPTQKPVALLEYLIKTYTVEGETVLDNCMGSGSTGIACINTKRNFIGIEKDDEYFEIAKKRIEEHLTTAST